MVEGDAAGTKNKRFWTIGLVFACGILIRSVNESAIISTFYKNGHGREEEYQYLLNDRILSEDSEIIKLTTNTTTTTVNEEEGTGGLGNDPSSGVQVQKSTTTTKDNGSQEGEGQIFASNYSKNKMKTSHGKIENDTMIEGEKDEIKTGPAELLLPGWLRRYAAWHRRKKEEFFGAVGDNNSTSSNSNSDAKFLVMTCQTRAQCGGFTDRMGSLLYWLRQAERSNRILLIHWTKGYSLEHFWVPPPQGLDWVLPNTSLGDELFSCVHNYKKKQGNLNGINATLFGPPRVVCVKTQFKLNANAIKSNFYADQNETMSTETFSRIFRLMFMPSTELYQYICNSIKGMGLDPESSFLAAHIRAGYPLRAKHNITKKNTLIRPNIKDQPELVQSWAKNAVRSVVAAYKKSRGNHDSHGVMDKLVVYVTSDRPEVVAYLKSTNEKEGNGTVAADVGWPLIVGLESMKRAHIEFAQVQQPSELFPLFFDLWMLSHSKCVSYGLGGYGRFGADLGGTGCMTQHRRSNSWNHYSGQGN